MDFEKQYKIKYPFFYSMIKEIQEKNKLSFKKAVDMFNHLNDEADDLRKYG